MLILTSGRARLRRDETAGPPPRLEGEGNGVAWRELSAPSWRTCGSSVRPLRCGALHELSLQGGRTQLLPDLYRSSGRHQRTRCVRNRKANGRCRAWELDPWETPRGPPRRPRGPLRRASAPGPVVRRSTPTHRHRRGDLDGSARGSRTRWFSHGTHRGCAAGLRRGRNR